MEEHTYKNTEYYNDQIARCEDLEALQQDILPKLTSQRISWANKANEILKTTGYSKSKFAEVCGVSRVSVDKWCKGSIPKNRETFLRIAMAANFGIEETNQLLQRYGRYPALYSKSLEDCVCIYVINSNFIEEKITKYQYILDKIKANIIRPDNAPIADITTEKFDSKLLAVQTEEELEQFISDNIAVFSMAYHKFYAYVKMNIEANYMAPMYASNIFEMSQVQGWSSSLKQCVSAIRQNKWYPTRNKIISLGLHLSMDHEQIDEMLALAHMEPLCGKNIFESVIMFILDDASLQNIMDTTDEFYDPDRLCQYAQEVLSELELPEMEDFISELPEVEDAW